MRKFLKSAPKSNDGATAGDGSAPAAGPPDSRLIALLGQPPPKPADALDLAAIEALTAPKRGGAGGEDEFSSRGRSSKRPRPEAATGAGPAAGPVDVAVLPSARRLSGGGSDSGVSRGSGGVSDGFDGYSCSADRDGHSGDGSGGENSKRGGNRGSGALGRRRSTAVGGGGGGSGSSARSNVSASKMGPWLRRRGETAVCAEEGYDPLELMHDANRDIFGNDAFRGVQEDVSGSAGERDRDREGGRGCIVRAFWQGSRRLTMAPPERSGVRVL